MGWMIVAELMLFAFIAAICLTWFFIHKIKVKERLLLIEKGIDPSQLRTHSKSGISWLKIGIVITAASSGLIIGFVVESMTQSDNGPFLSSPFQSWQFPLPILLMFLLGGIGMILAHIIDKPKDQP